MLKFLKRLTYYSVFANSVWLILTVVFGWRALEYIYTSGHFWWILVTAIAFINAFFGYVRIINMEFKILELLQNKTKEENVSI